MVSVVEVVGVVGVIEGAACLFDEGVEVWGVFGVFEFEGGGRHVVCDGLAVEVEEVGGRECAGVVGGQAALLVPVGRLDVRVVGVEGAGGGRLRVEVPEE